MIACLIVSGQQHEVEDPGVVLCDDLMRQATYSHVFWHSFAPFRETTAHAV